MTLVRELDAITARCVAVIGTIFQYIEMYIEMYIEIHPLHLLLVPPRVCASIAYADEMLTKIEVYIEGN